MKKIILFGAPGSGKDTQAEMLSQKLGVPHISTGDLIREEMKINQDLKVRMEAGELASFEEMEILLEKRLSMDDLKNGYILNGYPRFLEQAKKSLDTHLLNSVCIEIVVSRNESKTRIAKRAKMSSRKEDLSDDVIDLRLDKYESETIPAINYISGKYFIHKINGEQLVREVFQDTLYSIEN